MILKLGKKKSLTARDISLYKRTLTNLLDKFVTKEDRRILRSLSDLYGSIYRDITDLYNVHSKTPRTKIAKEIVFPWSGMTYSDRIRGNADKVYRKLVDVPLKKMRMKDVGLDEVLESINTIMDKFEKQHELLQNVEQEHAVNMASQLAFKKCGIRTVVWYTRLDERVCEICGNLHGQEFEVGNVPRIPAHPHCRCRLVTK